MQTTIAIDLAKSVFEIAISHRPGKVRERHRLGRARVVRFFAQQPPATVLMEACSSAHFWARQLQEMGHHVVLQPPHRVRHYRQGPHKTDRADCKALLEAFRNEEIHPVPVKTLEQQTLAAMHRMRSQWVGHRTARINGARALLREFGFTVPLGARRVVPAVRALLDSGHAAIPGPVRYVLAESCDEIVGFEQRIRAAEQQLRALGAQTPTVAHLRSIPGVGWLTATALVAFVGDPHRFASGRHFASYLGLVPREYSSGHKRRLGRISKRGDTYLRMLLIHGARAVIAARRRQPPTDRLRLWALDLARQRGHNKATVALANKLARIAWAVWKQQRDYAPDTLSEAA